MKTSWVVFTLLLTITGLARAVPPENPEQVNAMIAELKSLHQQGVELHRTMIPRPGAAWRQAEHAGLGAQATELRNRARCRNWPTG